MTFPKSNIKSNKNNGSAKRRTAEKKRAGRRSGASRTRRVTEVQSGWRNVPNTETEPYVTFSVIIPAYNAGEYVLRAMESVMNQTTKESIEIVVIDDCSRDNTFELISDYARRHPCTKERSIMVLRNSRNSGVAYSRNEGVKYAGGEYIAFLDADDWWAPEKLELQYDFLLKKCNEIFAEVEHAKLSGIKMKGIYPVLCCTGRELADPEGNMLGKVIGVPEEITYDMLLKTNHIPCSSVILKRVIALEFPMRRDDLHEDYLTWLLITKKYGPAIGLDRPLLKSCLTPGGKSRNKFKSAQMQYKCYKVMKISPLRAYGYLLQYMIAGINKYR